MHFNYCQNWMAFSYLHKPPFSEHNSIYFVNNRPPDAQHNDAYCKVSKYANMNRFVVDFRQFLLYEGTDNRKRDRHGNWGLSACMILLARRLRRTLFFAFSCIVFSFPFSLHALFFCFSFPTLVCIIFLMIFFEAFETPRE